MKKIIYILLPLAVFLTSCGSGDTVEITFKEFGDEVTITQNFAIEFNRDLASDDQLNQWDSTTYIKFEPAIEGAFNWESANRLVFSPSDKLPPATAISGTVTKAVLRNNPDLKLGKETSFQVKTTALIVHKISTYWARVNPESKENPTVFVDLNFNFPINVADIEDKLGLKVDGKEQGISLSTEEEFTRNIRFYANKVELSEESIPIEVTIQPGLIPLGGKNATEDIKQVKATLGSPFQFKVTNLSANYDGSKGILTIITSQTPQENDLKKYLEIVPKVKFEVEPKSNGFVITSEGFDVTGKYELLVKKGIEGKVGGLLKSEYREQFSFGNVKPTIKFSGTKARFLSKDGYKNVNVQILNVKEVEVVVSKIYENNALKFLSTKEYNYDYDTDEYYYGYNYNSGSSQSDEIWTKKIKTAELEKDGSYSILNLDFEDKLSKYNGIYTVQVRSTENRWLNDSRVIAISDIGIIAKRGKKQLFVFANSLSSANPIPGAIVTAFGRNNQKISSATTNTEGVAIINLDNNLPGGFEPEMVTISSSDDYNLLDLHATATRTSRFEVGGKYLRDAQYEGFVFMERDLYRPGEDVSFAFIVRDRNWGLPGQIPVKIKVTTPDGREFINMRKTLGDQGSSEGSFSLPKSSLTGNYRLAIHTSNNQFLTSQAIKVEEFLPDRIKVVAELDKTEYLASDTKMKLDISAVNFFGPPAANKKYEVRVQLSRSGFYPSTLRGYNFNYHKTNTQLYDINKEGLTNDEGKANVTLDIPSNNQNTGIINLNGFVTVIDETGRPVSVRKGAKIYTQDVFFGLKSDDYWVKTGDIIYTNLVASDKEGRVLNGQKATVKIVKREYKTVLSKSGGYFRYRSQSYERVIEEKEMEIGGKDTKVSFIPDLSGQYEVRIYPPGVNNYITREFYAYGYGSTTVNSFEVDNEGEVDIIFDKEKYEVGEKAKVILKAPFSGTVLVTVENDDVQNYFYVKTENKAAQFELDILDNYLPNVFLSATLFKPQQTSDIPLTVAHGYAPMTVEKASAKLDVQITAIEKSRSNQTQKIKIKTSPGAMVGLAVVDEGILQVSQYKTPDPYSFFYGKRALEVKSYDLYPYLFPEIASGGLTGGGADLSSKLASRINPLNNDRVELVSFWKGVAKADNNGEIIHEIDIPQYSGDLRIMAIAFSNDAFGSGRKNMKVADPIVISPGIPRFLSPGDSLFMPVAISNTTDEEIKASVTISSEGLVKTNGKSSENVTFSGGKESMLYYKLYAQNDIGQGKIQVKVDASGDEYLHNTSITVRPNSPLLKLTGSGVIKGSTTKKVETEDLDFIPSTINRKLVVSKSPMVEFTKDLSYLLRYPYGCLEQTTSQGFPLLYYSNVSKSVSNSKEHEAKNANYIVKEAIKRIYLMQLYTGGFTYWPGRGTESFWGSVYATHFLVEARRAGYDVDADVLSKALSYLKKRANEKRVIDYYYTYLKKRPIYPRGNIYSLYVLALAGETQLSTMNFYLSKQDFLSTDSKYLLSAAYALSGDASKINTIIKTRFTPESTIRSTGGSFYSPLRDEAIALTALLDVDPENDEIPIMAKHVSESLKSNRWFSTQERAFSLIALGRISKEAERSNMNADVMVDGQKVAEYKNTKEPLTVSGKDLAGDVSVSTNGDGTLYYFWETEGMSKDGSFVEEDSYLKVRRTYYKETGGVADLSNIKQNDRLIVKLSISNIFDKKIDNIVITDMLPACFEVENPRIGALPNYRWIKDQSTPDHSDFRDDRVHLFTDLNYGRVKNYYYVVRAVSKGEYNLGPAAADAMYNNEYHSYSGGGKVKVK